MALRVQQVTRIGFFKTPKAKLARQKEKAPRERKAKRPGNDAAHLANITKLRCIVCGTHRNIHPHHLKCAGGRGAQMRAPDKFAIPLCGDDHMFGADPVEKHGRAGELTWFEKRGIDPIALSKALWAARGNLEAMQRVWKGFWESKKR